MPAKASCHLLNLATETLAALDAAEAEFCNIGAGETGIGPNAPMSRVRLRALQQHLMRARQAQAEGIALLIRETAGQAGPRTGRGGRIG
ncbi:hypothetical protein [Roseivivax sp. CAU 1761]